MRASNRGMLLPSPALWGPGQGGLTTLDSLRGLLEEARLGEVAANPLELGQGDREAAARKRLQAVLDSMK